MAVKRLALGALAAAVVCAAALFLDPPGVGPMLLALAVALAASPWLLQPLDRGVGGLVAHASRAPSRLRSLDRSSRVLVLCAAGSGALMAVSVFGPWVDTRSGFELPHAVASDGWVVLLAGLTGCALVALAAPSSVGGASALAAGTLGAAAAFDVRDAVGGACGWTGGGGNVLGLFCSEPSVGWGLQLATVGSLGLATDGAAWLCTVGLRWLTQRRPAAPVQRPD